MSTFCVGAARARRQREAQGRRRPETAAQDGPTQEDGAIAVSEWRAARAGRC